MNAPLQVGAATTNTTCPLGTALIGSTRPRLSTEIHDELHAKAIVIQSGEETAALVVCDCIALGREDLDPVRAMIEERCGIPRTNVLISATHTHTGPATASLLSVDREAGYCEWLRVRVADAVQLAHSRLRPAEWGYAVGSEPGQVFNRRYRMKDGTVRTNPGSENPEVVEPVGPVDPEVGVLVFREPAGPTIAVLTNYALHYVGGGNGFHVSADYFAAFGEALQRMRGEAFVAPLANGACGDVNNLNVFQKLGPRGPWEQMERVSRAVAAEAVKAWNRIEFSADPPALTSRWEWLRIGVRQPSADQVTEARRLLEEFGEVSARADLATPWTVEHAFGYDRLALLDQPKEVETPVQVLRLGDLALVGLPGEMFCQIGLDIKDQSPFSSTFVIELANDYIGYVCTEEAFEQGSYEPTLAQSSKLVPEAAARMTESAVRLLRQLHRDA